MPSAPLLVKWGELMTGRLPPGIGFLCLASLALLVVRVPGQSSIGVPTNLTHTVSGARTIELSWDYSSSQSPPNGYRITLDTLPTTNTMTFTTTQMSIVINGVVPFDYTSSAGEVFVAQVLAFDSRNDGQPVSTGTIVVPPCPGKCDYRYYTTSSSSCAFSRCICSSAYSGSNCSTPNFFPGNVSGVLDTSPSGDPIATVTWDTPNPITLDGRIITMFRLIIETTTTNRLTNLIPYAPDSNGNGHYSRSTSVSSSFTDAYNLKATVRTITDDSDFADSQPQPFATHVPGPVQNLSAVFVNSTSIRVMWDPPFDDDGLVSMYQLLFPGSIINIDPELRLYNVIVTLAGNTAYSITMMARNSMGLGEAANTSLTTPVFCPANTFLSGTSCPSCHDNSVSPAISLSESDCQCVPGYEILLFGLPICIPCERGRYKDVIGNSHCVACPFPLRTTASTAAPSLENCNVCRYTDGTYPTDTCYYFNVTGSVTAMAISNGFNIFWSGVPATVQGYDKNLQRLTPAYSVVNLEVSCVSTGRGVLPSGYSYNQTINTTRLTPPVVNQGADLNELVEYSCTISIGAQISSQLTAYGPTSNPALVLTQAFGNSVNALPRITSVNFASSLHIVNFELDSRLLPFVNSISVFHTSEGDPSNIRITTLLPSQYSIANPSIGIQGIPTSQRANFYLNSSIDNVIYISDTVELDALMSQTSPSATTVQMSVLSMSLISSGLAIESTGATISSSPLSSSASSQFSISFSSTMSTSQMLSTSSTTSGLPSEVTSGVMSNTPLPSPSSSQFSISFSSTMQTSQMLSTSSTTSGLPNEVTSGVMSNTPIPSPSSSQFSNLFSSTMQTTQTPSMSSTTPSLTNEVISSAMASTPLPSPLSSEISILFSNTASTSQMLSTSSTTSGLPNEVTSGVMSNTPLPSTSSSQFSISFSSTMQTTQTPSMSSTTPSLTNEVISAVTASTPLPSPLSSEIGILFSSTASTSSELTSTVQSSDVLFSVGLTPSLPSSVLSNTMVNNAMTSTLPSSTQVSSSTMTLTPFTTEVPTDPPGLQAPGRFTATLISDTMARLSWQAVTGASGYRVTYQSTEVGSPPVTQDIIGDSVLELTITDLQPYSNYSLTIAAVDARGVIGQMTEPQVLETPEAMSSPPRNVVIVEEDGIILIQWEIPEMPNGIITNYVVIVTSQSLSGTYEVGSDIYFVRVPKPPTQYSVTVQAMNGAGKSLKQGAMFMATTADTPTGSSAIIPTVVGAVVGALLFLSLVIVLCLGCCCYYRRNKRRQLFILTGHTKSNKYIAKDRPPMDIPVKGSTPLSYYNPLAEASLAQDSILTQQTDFSASNLKSLEAGEEQYAEISQEQRLGAVERAAIVICME